MAIPPDREEDHNYHREMPDEGHEEARSNVIKRKRCSNDFVNDVLADDNDDGNLGLELEIGVCGGGEKRLKGKRCSDDFVNHVALADDDDDDDGSLDLKLEIDVGRGGGESRPKRKRGSEFVNNVALAVDNDDGSLGLELEVGCGGGGGGESRRKRKICSDFINHVGLADGYRDGRLGLELEVVGDGGESHSKRRRVYLDLNKVYDSDQEEDYEKQYHDVEEAAALISSCSLSGNYTEYYDEHDEGPDWEQEVSQDDLPKHGDDHVEELAAVVVVPDETSINHLDQQEHGGFGTTGIDWDHCDCDSNQYPGSPDNGQVNQDVERLVSTVEEKDEEVIRGYTFSGGGDLFAAASHEDPEAKLQVKPFNFLPDLNEYPPSDHTPKFPFMPDQRESLV